MKVILFQEPKNIFMILVLVYYKNPDTYIFKNDNKLFTFIYINILIEDTQLCCLLIFFLHSSLYVYKAVLYGKKQSTRSSGIQHVLSLGEKAYIR